MAENQQAIKHVMISYKWQDDSQKRMLKLKEELEKVGYIVWMDVEELRGNMYERMAKAVENSAAVLVCFSKEYQGSEPCKQEAEYAKKLKKPIIPLQFKTHDPTGWLGIIIGALIYNKVDTEEHMMESLPKIIKTLDDEGVKRRPGFPDYVPGPVPDTPDSPGSKSEMDHKAVLDAALKNLTENLNPDDMLISLVSEKAITSDHKQEIKTQPSPAKQVEKLVELLRTREREHYESFMNVLKEKRPTLWEDVKSKEGGETRGKPMVSTTSNRKPDPMAMSNIIPGKIMTEVDLTQLAEIIGKTENLLAFYIRLGMESTEVEYAERQGQTPTTKALKVLLEWLKCNGEAATSDKIKAAMVAMKKWSKQIALFEKALNE